KLGSSVGGASRAFVFNHRATQAHRSLILLATIARSPPASPLRAGHHGPALPLRAAPTVQSPPCRPPLPRSPPAPPLRPTTAALPCPSTPPLRSNPPRAGHRRPALPLRVGPGRPNPLAPAAHAPPSAHGIAATHLGTGRCHPASPLGASCSCPSCPLGAPPFLPSARAAHLPSAKDAAAPFGRKLRGGDERPGGTVTAQDSFPTLPSLTLSP
ncbi:unnamed protein product, partial [Urochloa humidicola]